jgi:hypothetical protein
MVYLSNLFAVYFATLSVAQIIQSNDRIMINELERTRKK